MSDERWQMALFLVILVVAGCIAWGTRADGAVVATTQNVYVGLGPAKARHDLRQAASGGSIVVAQEMMNRRASRFAPSGWGAAQVRGPQRQRGDCATYWDRSVWSLVSYRDWWLSREPFRHGYRWGLTTVLRERATGRKLNVVCLHLFTRGAHRLPALRRAMHRLTDVLSRLSGPRMVGGDWNVRSRVKAVRSALRRSYDTHPPRGSLIDYWWFGSRTLRLQSVRCLCSTYSDHNGVRVRLGWR